MHSISQDNESIQWELFTCQAEFHGNVFNATKRCRIMNNDRVQKVEFSVIYKNIDVSIDANYSEKYTQVI